MAAATAAKQRHVLENIGNAQWQFDLRGKDNTVLKVVVIGQAQDRNRAMPDGSRIGPHGPFTVPEMRARQVPYSPIVYLDDETWKALKDSHNWPMIEGLMQARPGGQPELAHRVEQV